MSKADVGVLLVERWILARLRHHRFFSLDELNREIRRLLELLNNRPFQKLIGSRRSQYESIDQTGPTGAGKSYLACAFAQKACRSDYTASYQRMPRLFGEINLAKGDRRYAKLMAGLAKVDLLVLDDFGLQPLNQEQRHDLLELLEDRYQLRSTLVAGQLPHEHWHEQIGDPTLADAILDRLISNAHIIQLVETETNLLDPLGMAGKRFF